MRQDVGFFAVVDERCELRPSAATGRPRDAASGSPERDPGWMNAWRNAAAYHALLGLRHASTARSASSADTTALPGGAEYPADCRQAFNPSCASEITQLHATQAAPRQALEKPRPERLGFRRTDMQPDDLALAVRCSTATAIIAATENDPAALALLPGRSHPATDTGHSPTSGRSRNA